MSLRKRLRGVGAGPAMKKLTFVFAASSALVLVAYSIVDGTIDKFGSEECLNVSEDLSKTWALSVKGGNQNLIENVLSEISLYEQGMGERALGDMCVFDELRKKISNAGPK